MKRPNPEVTNTIELSILMPCLNEAETLGACIEKARMGIERSGVRGEILVADNGSQDSSVQIAEECGARVIHVEKKGYGNAWRVAFTPRPEDGLSWATPTGVMISQRLIISSKNFVKDFELVMGCRLPSGGGKIMPGAMPFSHRWLGNPLFSRMARHMFAVPIHDVYCGLRGFTRELYERLDLRCEGMEFATEMIIKASLHGARISEIPITLHPDGRKTQAPHLRTIRDGWRTLRFFLILSPQFLFLAPGFFLVLLGLTGYALALPGLKIGGVTFDAHTLLFRVSPF